MKKKIYELLRKHVARRATGNLGKVEIKEDEIICYVDGKKIKKKEKYIHRYNLIFKCIPTKEKKYIKYNVNKPVHYIVKNIEFDKEINIMASMKKCHVTFEKCIFTAAVMIDFADHITFINNTHNAQQYKNYFSYIKEGEFLISTKANKNEINKIDVFADSIYVPNVNCLPIVEYPEGKITNRKIEPIIEIWLYAKEINIIGTNIIGAKNIEIGADKLIITDSNISSKEIEINAQSFEDYLSNIFSDIISIETNEYDDSNKMISSNSIFINGIEMNKNEPNINEKTISLQKQRLELINSLKKIEGTCEEQISKEIRKEPLTRILRK